MDWIKYGWMQCPVPRAAVAPLDLTRDGFLVERKRWIMNPSKFTVYFIWSQFAR